MKLGGKEMRVYETGKKDSGRVIIAVYDVLGLTSETKQVSDQIADLVNCRLVMPDFLGKHVWLPKDYPPKKLVYELEGYYKLINLYL